MHLIRMKKPSAWRLRES